MFPKTLAVIAFVMPLAAVDTAAPAGGPAVQAMPVAAARWANLQSHEPMFFLADVWMNDRGTINGKFQVSVAFRAVDPLHEPHQPTHFVWTGRGDGLYVSFTQASLWDWDTESNPFYDTSYKPEVWYHWNPAGWKFPGASASALEFGFGHESNGKGVGLSRSLNILFARPIASYDMNLWDMEALLRPKAYIYVDNLEDNKDLPEYRGYCDFEFGLGQWDGLWLNNRFRVGDEFDKGSIQADLSFPADKLPWVGKWLDGLMQVQFFYGYNETLLDYDQKVWRVSFGLAATR